MGQSIAQKAAVAAAIGGVVMNRVLVRAGLRARADGWRRGAGLVLRQEPATFVLSAFNLDVWSDAPKLDVAARGNAADEAHVASRLAEFLAKETTCHVHVVRGVAEDRVVACPGPAYTLGFEPWAEGPARFIRPDRWAGRNHSPSHPGTAAPLFEFICRLSPAGAADVWIRINHIGMDGVPAQEILSRLEAAWGIAGPVEFPSPEHFRPHAVPRPSPGRDGLVDMQAFLDCSPLLAWRKRQNQRLPESMTLSAALLWCLAKHRSFSALRMGTTVDIPAQGNLGRGVGVLVVRPANYFSRADGLVQYVRTFNRDLALTRVRQSAAFKTLDAAAHLSPRLATPLLRHALKGDRAFGSMALSVIRDAKVFGAPMGDAGHPDGFIALGSTSLDAGAGRKVGCLTIKGSAKVAAYPQWIQEAMEQLAADAY